MGKSQRQKGQRGERWVAKPWERFDQKVRTGRGCWEWQGAKNPNGYGRVWNPITEKVEAAHRVAFFFAYGRTPRGDCCHKCDNPSCVRPSHLFDGSRKTNMEDAMQKGRLRRKWSQEQVDEVVELRREGVKLKDIAYATGIPQGTVSYLCRTRGVFSGR